MTDPVCVMCGQPGYSHSVEHGNDWLCFGHYQQFLETKEELIDVAQKAWKKMKEEAKARAK